LNGIASVVATLLFTASFHSCFFSFAAHQSFRLVSPSGREDLTHAWVKARSAQKKDRCRFFCLPRVFEKNYRSCRRFLLSRHNRCAFIPRSKNFISKNLAFPQPCDKKGLLRVRNEAAGVVS